MMGENLMTKRVLIKYGEKEHLEETCRGQDTIRTITKLCKNGRRTPQQRAGDLLEGKLVFYAENLKFTRTDTGERFCVPGKEKGC